MLRSNPTLILSLLAAVLLSSLPPAANGQEVLNGLAAVVNKDPITFSQVRDLVGPQERAARNQLTGQALVEKIKEIRLAALNELINRQLDPAGV